MVLVPSYPSTFNLAPPYLFKNSCHALIALLGFDNTPSCLVPKNCCHLFLVAVPLFPSTFNVTTFRPLPLLLECFLIYLVGSTVLFSCLAVQPKLTLALFLIS